METETIVKAVIIVMVIIVLVLIPMKGWPIVKTLLNMDEDIIPQVAPESVKAEFQNIVNSYEECFATNDNDCLCDINILNFPSGYYLAYYGKNVINLERSVAGAKEVVRNVFDKKNNIGCYISYLPEEKCSKCGGGVKSLITRDYCTEYECKNLDTNDFDCYQSSWGICNACPDDCNLDINIGQTKKQSECSQCTNCEIKNNKCVINKNFNKNVNMQIGDIPEAYFPLSFVPRILVMQEKSSSFEDRVLQGKEGKLIFNLVEARQFYIHRFLDGKAMFYKKDNNICFVIESQLSDKGKDNIKTLSKCK